MRCRPAKSTFFEEVPPDFLPTLAANPAVKTMPQDTLGMQMVFRMNTVVPPFNNQKIRQAISYMIDQDKFARAYVSDPKLYKNCPSFYMCTSPFFTNTGWPKTGSRESAQARRRERL